MKPDLLHSGKNIFVSARILFFPSNGFRPRVVHPPTACHATRKRPRRVLFFLSRPSQTISYQYLKNIPSFQINGPGCFFMTFPLPTKTRLSPSDDADGESREQGFDKAESLGKRRGGGAGGGEGKPFFRKVSPPPPNHPLSFPRLSTLPSPCRRAGQAKRASFTEGKRGGKGWGR